MGRSQKHSVPFLMLVYPVIICVLFSSLFLRAAGHKVDECDFTAKGLAKLKEGDKCKCEWKYMRFAVRPTQNSVGYAWVQRIAEKDMSSKFDAQDEMDGTVVPVVVAQFSNKMYVIDHHHHLAALDYASHDSVRVTVYIVCNLSEAEASSTSLVFSVLQSKKMAYLYGRPRGSPNELPTPVSQSSSAFPVSIAFNKTFTTMADDRWRSLVGFTRKIKADDCSKDNKYCVRCFDRVCASSGASIPFFEYRWAYLFNDAYLHSSIFNSSFNAAAFAAAYNALPLASPGGADVDAWASAAQLLLPLCRGDSAGDYSVPSSMGAFSGKLPGYHAGNSPIDEPDPMCAYPKCINSNWIW